MTAGCKRLSALLHARLRLAVLAQVLLDWEQGLRALQGGVSALPALMRGDPSFAR
ncbi:hypothetical protein [Derxia lacustris]|uniref:hypothetical protein n=1 Tax=Derxia lacustris TaxID=764842 RepID=UPI001592E584|nr:hypothetical protein [Derxia lacustris]